MQFTVIKSAQELEQFFNEFDREQATKTARQDVCGAWWPEQAFNEFSVNGIRHTSRKGAAS